MPVASVLHLRDGSLALGGATLIAIQPSSLATLEPGSPYATAPQALAEPMLTIVPQQTGTGRLVAAVGNDTLDVPLTIAPGTSR